jgi:hypothetical protein
MGIDMRAYIDIDQEEIENFITENGLDKNKWDDSDKIAMHVKQSYPEFDYLIYYWNEECKLHEVYEVYSTGFLCDDPRLTNPRFHRILEEKLHRKYPDCLRSINFYIKNDKDALEVASELRIFFPEECDLMCFAEWCEMTAKYCSTYELSFKFH